MQTIPKEYILLKKINGYINELLVTSTTKEIARLSDIYDYIKNKDNFRQEFHTPVEFSRFMRKMHNKNVLKQFIKNCSVDTTIPYRYQWRFYPQDRIMKKETTLEDPNVADSHPDTSNFIPWTKIHLAANGAKVRSKQELYIMNQLLAVECFDIYYEKPLKEKSHKRYPDFTIRNKTTNKTFLWEHFGINNELKYGENMAERLLWYKKIGYEDIKAGGRLIVTVYEDEDQFVGLVQKMICKIKEIECPS